GSAASFAVLAGSGVSNAGISYVFGNLAVYPSIAVTGFSVTVGIDGYLNGTQQLGTPTALEAKLNVTNAYNKCMGAPVSVDYSGTDLGGLTLTKGVYKFGGAAALTGILTLKGKGVFIFQIASALTINGGSQIILTRGATAGCIFWQVGSSATLGLNSQFSGIILAYTSISVATGVHVSGSLFAQNGAVTLISDIIHVRPRCMACH
ncbi:unnamed protein product, partial [Didymodactylos carnosus]